LTKWFAKHPGVPFPSVKAIADSKLVHPLHQALFEEAAAAGPVEQDSVTLADVRNERRYQEAFPAAMDAERIDALVFPSWAQLPTINGDRNTQLVAEPKAGNAPTALSSSLQFVASSLQWPAISVPRGYLGEDLPQGLQIVGRPWEEAKIIGYAYSYEQATHHRHPPASTPPLVRE
jgi:Asp-tRNA(Asn)/Glu-tRNA(Gln) amidotransferase A subunit family amidase